MPGGEGVGPGGVPPEDAGPVGVRPGGAGPLGVNPEGTRPGCSFGFSADCSIF